jgi:uncharacterized membrane protein YdbT with pleckstrin-like domain
MEYIEQNLLKGEEVKYRTKLHWIIFIKPVILIIIGIFIFLTFSENSMARLVSGIFVFIGIIMAVPHYATYRSSEFAITNKRVVMKAGMIDKRSLELLLQKIEAVGVEQDVWGSIFGYGTITITGTGGTKEPFNSIENPLEFRKQVEQSISE